MRSKPATSVKSGRNTEFFVYRKCKLDILRKVWKEMKLLFYLFTIILQFRGMVDGMLDLKGQYLLGATTFIMLIDEYISMLNEARY